MNDNEDKRLERQLFDDDRISRFMQGHMDAEKETAFLEEIKDDEDLRNRAITQARLVKGMKQVDEEIKDAFRQSDEQAIKRIAQNATNSTNSPQSTSRWLAVAASVALIVLIGFKSYDYYDTISLGREYADAFPVSTIIRGDATVEVESELSMLFENIVKGKDLEATTSRLATLWELSKKDTYNDYTDYAPYIGWNLAVGYLQDYEKKKAKEILLEMSQMYPEETAIGQSVHKIVQEL